MAHKNKTNISPYKTRNDPKGIVRPKLGTHQKPTEIYSVDEANDRLYDVFRNHGFGDFPHDKRRELAKFYRLLMEHQEVVNFTRLLKIKDIAIKHYIDCLMVAKLTDLTFPLLDMGTGPGFPGIPLKIMYPDQRIILGEGVQKRVEFLKQVREKMELKNLDIIGRNINPYFAYPVNGVITRAVEDVGNTLRNVLSCLQTGGKVFLMKGPNVDPEIKAVDADLKEFYTLEKDIAYTLPETTHNRRLLIYKKIKMAPLPDFDEEPWPEDD